MSTHNRQLLLDPGFELTLRPMRYPQFYEMYRNAIRNTWTVEEVDFSLDTADLKTRFGPAERHLVERLIAFFATGDSIVSNNLVLNLYQHINAPEARMYLSRQLYEEALHVQFYLTLLDTYLPDPDDRARASAAPENIPSLRRKPEFCVKWIASGPDRGPPAPPDPARHLPAGPGRTRQGIRRDREHPVDPAQGRVLLQVDRQRAGPRAHRDARATPPVPAQPGLLRRLHRGFVLLRRVRLRLLPALARTAARAGIGHQLGVPRRKLPHGVRVRGDPHRARGGAGPGRRRLQGAGGRDDDRGGGVRGRVRAGHPVGRRRRAVGQGHARIPGVLRRPAHGAAGHAETLQRAQPVPVHGAAGRAGAGQLLRAARIGVPGRRAGRGRLRPRVLKPADPCAPLAGVASVGALPAGQMTPSSTLRDDNRPSPPRAR